MKDLFKGILELISYLIFLGSGLGAVILEIICLAASIGVFGAGFITFNIGEFLLGFALLCFHWVLPLLLLCIGITIGALLYAVVSGERL